MSSKDIQKARRMAKRIRASVACARCKAAKSKCSDFRPCKHCLNFGAVCEEVNTAAHCIPTGRNDRNHPIARSAIMEGSESWPCQPHTSLTLPELAHHESLRFASACITNQSGTRSNANLSMPQYLPLSINYDVYHSIPSALRFQPSAQQLIPAPLLFASALLPSAPISLQQQQPAPALPPAIAALLLSNGFVPPAASVPPTLAPAAGLRLLLALAARPPALV